jgi:hypothetical protein
MSPRDLRRVSSNRDASPITALRSTLTMRSFLCVLMTGRTDRLAQRRVGQLFCKSRTRRWRSEGHVQTSFGSLRLGRERAYFDSFVSLRQSRPEPRRDVNRCEDPNRLYFASDDRPNLVCLKLLDNERGYFSIVEPTTNVGCLFKPSSDGIPGDPLYPGDRRRFRPSTVSMITSSNVARRCWSRW